MNGRCIEREKTAEQSEGGTSLLVVGKGVGRGTLKSF